MQSGSFGERLSMASTDVLGIIQSIKANQLLKCECLLLIHRLSAMKRNRMDGDGRLGHG